MLVIVSDIHLGSGSNLGPNRELDLIKSLDQVINYAVKKKVKYFISLGDNFERPNPANYLRKLFADRLHRLSKNGIQTFILVGNHEFANRHHALSSISNLKINKVHIIDEPIRMLDKDDEWIFLPHNVDIDSKAIMWDEIFNRFRIKEGKRRIVLGHFPVTGSKVGPSDFILKTDVNIGMLKKLNADLICLGDIHSPQKLFDKCRYVGSADRIDFGERKDKKSFLYIDKKFNVKKIKIKNRQLKYFIVGKDDPKSMSGAIIKPIINCDEADVNKFDTNRILEELKDAHHVLPFEWNITDRIKKEGQVAIKDIDIKKYLKKFIKRNFPKKNTTRLVRIYEKIKIKEQ